jgi:hypothetical protein
VANLTKIYNSDEQWNANMKVDLRSDLEYIGIDIAHYVKTIEALIVSS